MVVNGYKGETNLFLDVESDGREGDDIIVSFVRLVNEDYKKVSIRYGGK